MQGSGVRCVDAESSHRHRVGQVRPRALPPRRLDASMSLLVDKALRAGQRPLAASVSRRWVRASLGAAGSLGGALLERAARRARWRAGLRGHPVLLDVGMRGLQAVRVDVSRSPLPGPLACRHCAVIVYDRERAFERPRAAPSAAPGRRISCPWRDGCAPAACGMLVGRDAACTLDRCRSAQAGPRHRSTKRRWRCSASSSCSSCALRNDPRSCAPVRTGAPGATGCSRSCTHGAAARTARAPGQGGRVRLPGAARTCLAPGPEPGWRGRSWYGRPRRRTPWTSWCGAGSSCPPNCVN